MADAPFPLIRRLSAEFAGTLFLVAAVIGSGIMAERLTDDVALALLANTAATAAMLMVLIACLAPISSAHFNPAVTLAFFLRGDLGPMSAAAYALTQISGGIAGVVLAHLMFELPVLTGGMTVRSGWGQWLSEGVAAFGLVATILIAVRTRPKDVALLVGLFIAAAYWFTASTSFANPAVAIARSFTDTFSGIRPADAPAFIAAQLIGTTLAVAAVRRLFAGVPLQKN